jgi:nitrous oxide reductase
LPLARCRSLQKAEASKGSGGAIGDTSSAAAAATAAAATTTAAAATAVADGEHDYGDFGSQLGEIRNRGRASLGLERRRRSNMAASSM